MEPNSYLSLLQLQTLIHERLEGAFPLPMWVVAEISELKENYSGHCYLELVEKGGRNQVPKAKASAVIWRSSYTAIASYFRSVTGRELSVGLKVLIKVTVIFHELYGLSLQISDIDPRYTLGDMEQQRQQTIAQLQQDGVFDMNRELELSDVIQRIAVVSSKNAAGYQDFINEIASAPYRIQTTLFDAFMQGNGAEESIIAALDRVADQLDNYDVVVVIRGGGSQSDLGCFDSYRLCNHLAQFPLPVITGIGHDKDQSVADMVAAVALKTPTAVAGYIIDGLSQFDTLLDEWFEEVVEAADGLIAQHKSMLRQLVFEVSGSTARFTHSVENRLNRLASEVRRAGEAAVMRRMSHLELVEKALQQGVKNLLQRSGGELEMLSGLVDARRPERILAMGFSIVRRGGVVLKAAKGLNAGDDIEVEFALGSADAKVVKLRK